VGRRAARHGNPRKISDVYMLRDLSDAALAVLRTRTTSRACS
jgi:hypothetical protein